MPRSPYVAVIAVAIITLMLLLKVAQVWAMADAQVISLDQPDKRCPYVEGDPLPASCAENVPGQIKLVYHDLGFWRRLVTALRERTDLSWINNWMILAAALLIAKAQGQASTIRAAEPDGPAPARLKMFGLYVAISSVALIVYVVGIWCEETPLVAGTFMSQARLAKVHGVQLLEGLVCLASIVLAYIPALEGFDLLNRKIMPSLLRRRTAPGAALIASSQSLLNAGVLSISFVFINYFAKIAWDFPAFRMPSKPAFLIFGELLWVSPYLALSIYAWLRLRRYFQIRPKIGGHGTWITVRKKESSNDE